MSAVVLNARFAWQRTTGMQRYAWELARRFGDRLQPARPGRPLRGMSGHLWEQFCLPPAVGRRLLWSPNNTGPLAIARQVCTIHDLIPLDRPEWFAPRFASWYGWLLPRLARRVRHIIAVSEFTRSRILERFGIDPSRVTVIPNGVDGRFAPRPALEVERVRADLGLPTARYVLSVGSLEPRKNVNRLLEAWARAVPRLPEDLYLVVSGAKGVARVFSSVSLGRLPPRVLLTGYVPDEHLPALYSGATIFVYPSLYEGFGLPPLEAMACGTPVITSNTTSLPEVVGDAALLVDPLDVEATARAIERLAGDEAERARLRRLGLERIARFNWDDVAARTWEVLREHAHS